MSTSIQRSIERIRRYDTEIHKECSIIANQATDLFRRSAIADWLIDDITCECHVDDGVVLIAEINDNSAPHIVSVTAFFDLFTEERLSNIDILDFLCLSF